MDSLQKCLKRIVKWFVPTSYEKYLAKRNTVRFLVQGERPRLVKKISCKTNFLSVKFFLLTLSRVLKTGSSGISKKLKKINTSNSCESGPGYSSNESVARVKDMDTAIEWRSLFFPKIYGIFWFFFLLVAQNMLTA